MPEGRGFRAEFSMTAPVFEGYGAIVYDSSGPYTDITLDKPSGTVEGDLLVAQFRQSRVDTLAGWAPLIATGEAGFALRTFYKIATGSEPSSYTWTMDSNAYRNGVIVRISGVNTAAPINAVDAYAGGYGTLVEIRSVTTDVDDCLLIHFCGMNSGSITLTYPGGWTEQYDNGVVAATRVQATAGASPADTATASGNGWEYVQTVAIAPVPPATTYWTPDSATSTPSVGTPSFVGDPSYTLAPGAYALEVDSARDLTFVTKLTQYTLSANFEYGMASAFTDAGHPSAFGMPARMDVYLFNRDGAFLPEKAGALFQGVIRPGQLARLRAADANGSTVLFLGRIESIEVPPSRNVAQVAHLVVTDITERLLDAEYKPPLQLHVRTDEALAALFDVGLVPWPYASHFWMVGVSQLGISTALYEDTLLEADAGRTTLAYVGDNLDNGQGISAQGYLRDVVSAEAGGRFCYDAARGKYIFHSRAHDTLYSDTVHTFDADDFLASTPYLWGDNLINALTVLFQKRTVSDELGVLWRYPGDYLLLPILGSRTITVRYTDPDNPGVQVSALSVVPPVPGVDFQAWDDIEQTGDRNARIGISISHYGNGATITITNNDVDDDIYIYGLQLRGYALTAFTLDSVFYLDPDSIAAYERREPMPMDLRIVDDEEFAYDVAEFVVNRYKEPVARFPELPFEAKQSDRLFGHALWRRIGDQVSVDVPSIGHQRNYVIVGQRHLIDAASGSHLVTWIVAPLTQTQYWVLGDAANGILGETTRLFL